ncbi:hypothetical protein KR009_008289 [Drosophila setifemur]|nr:hypothetical protein KR009_008289 [Drosophila setifemur]
MQLLKKFGLALTFVVVLLLLASSVESKRKSSRKKVHKIKLNRETNHTKILRGFRNQKSTLKGKLKITTDTVSAASLSPSLVAIESLTNAYNTEYYGAITLGGQSFNILFDTASANLWVPSSQCQEQVCLQHNQYNSSKSKTFTANGTAFEIQYATRVTTEVILQGFLSTDTLQIAGLSVKKQTFAEITSMPASVFSRSNFDGIFGLGFPNIAIGGVVPPFNNLIDQGLIDEPIFSLILNRNASDASNGGQVLLGGTDPTLFSGCLTYVPLSSVGYWQITVGSIQLGSDSAVCTNCEAIFDVGTSLIVTPAAALSSINTKLGITATDKRDGVYTIDCSKVSSLPNVIINIGRKDFTLKPSDYILNYSGTCVSGFTSLSDGSQDLTNQDGVNYNNLWVLGDVFLGVFYVEFDVGYQRIAIAPKV